MATEEVGFEETDPFEDEDLPSEKNAGLIMGTNSSSIVSKRSVERLYLPKPHFYRHFVRKPQRRSPTINRGYWLRMRAIDWVVRMFLARPSDRKKVVINLGCGYDPVPFQWLTTEPELCASAKFIDVDYRDLMISKRDIVLNTPDLRDILTLMEHSGNSEILLDSQEYSVIGCDLKNVRRIERLIKSLVDIQDCAVLCLAEVSITYMSVEDSDAVLSWSTTLSPDVTFCLLEQRSPDRNDNPFTATMIKHFEKCGTPLRTLSTYPGYHTQKARFMAAGYVFIEVLNLWELWGDPRFLSPSQRMALDHVEPFDEWEEFALFASHYQMVVAQTDQEPLLPELPREFERRDSEASNLSDFSTRTVSPYRPDNEWFAYTYSPNPGTDGRTHHGSSYMIPNQNAIGLHGGAGTRGRQATTSVYGPPDDDSIHPAVAPEDVAARCCHTITTLQNGQNLLVGGRSGPSSPFKDCWLQTENKWERVHDLPEGRYRHRAVSVILPDNTHGVVVVGGKTSATQVASNSLLWHPSEGWRKLRSLHQDPMPRFGQTFVRLGHNHGLMLGGMRQDGIVCQGLWRWRLIVRDSKVIGIKFKTSNALDTSAGIYPWLGRLGASYSLIRSELVVIGGIAKMGCIPREYEIISIIGSFSAFGDQEREMELRTICILPRMAPGVPRPMLIGHSSHRTQNEITLIAGGGCTCFSFGSYWNSGVWLMHDREQGVNSPFNLLKPTPPTPPTRPSANSLTNGGLYHPDPVEICSTTILTDSDFSRLLRSAVPRLLTGLDIGPCTTRWTPAYLKAKTDTSRKVVVHSSPTSTMNFQRKQSFTYTTLPFHSFLDIISNQSEDLQPHMYLRSISSTSHSQPANLATDWAEVASDFHLPPPLTYLTENHHSSPLRISTDLSMWLHYDVMANILFHVTSSPHSAPKRLILFPPSDIKYLSFPTGSTTSVLDIFPSPSQETTSAPSSPTAQNTAKTNHASIPKARIPPRTHPHVVTLPPGSALYIPPLWSHTAAPSPPGIVNISVNIFFYSLPRQLYAAGRDIYGNRDLAAYEDGRRDIDRIFKRFKLAKAAPHGVKKGATPSETKNEEKNGADNETDTSTITNGQAATPSTTTPSDPKPDPNEGTIPKDIAKAYLERLAKELLEKAAAL